MKNVIVWGLVSGILVGCNLTQPADASINDNNTIIVTAPSEAEPSEAEANTTQYPPLQGATYIDEVAGFSFTYPEGWWIYSGAREDALLYAITITSFEPEAGGRGGGISPDETKIDIYIDLTEPKTLDAAYAQMQGTVDEGMTRILEQEALTLASGLPALFTRVAGMMGGQADNYHMVINDHLISVAGFGDRQIIRQIADSVQPIR